MGLELPSGFYDVTIIYSIENDTKAVMEFVSYDVPDGMMSSKITLDASNDMAKGTILVKFGSNIDDLRISINVTEGDGSVQIQNIAISENIVYRFTRLLEAIVVILILNLTYLILFAGTLSVMGKIREIFIILGGILLFSCIPLLNNNIFFGHDIEFHLNRIACVASEISRGNIPIRIYSDMLNGYSYATPLFYCDSFLYLPALLYLAKIPLSTCYQIYIVVINALTILFCYMCLGKMTKDRKLVYLGVFLYVMAPYRLVNIYTRAAVGEFTAMTFFPLVILGFWNLYTLEKCSFKECIPTVLGLSGIIQSHIISTEMVAIFILIFCVLEWRKTFEPKRLAKLIGIVILTLAVICGF
jgi:hypothetical protein